MKAFSGSEPWRSVRALAKIVLCAVLALLSSAAAQDMQAAQELMDLTQQMKSADDPCPYLPQIRAKMNQMANSDPDVYEALKPSLDDINAMDLRCNAPAPSNVAGKGSPDASASQPEGSTANPSHPPLRLTCVTPGAGRGCLRTMNTINCGKGCTTILPPLC